ncbi:hypothetical protein [Parabacteroides faecis]|uniref:Lipoprotein n=1 Tax=Parabacteroides faecis TaxID=1217282 RepID=A0ABR6KQ79_9BACT|nr:hypothetical protein [Parabacteroides faecis]MBB4623576.1 hypothetical protein [Parabacteroides faecis]
MKTIVGNLYLWCMILSLLFSGCSRKKEWTGGPHDDPRNRPEGTSGSRRDDQE